ncbi:MAG: hypothetical protein AABZ06_00160 [Bdellovibrionota bacterium]
MSKRIALLVGLFLVLSTIFAFFIISWIRNNSIANNELSALKSLSIITCEEDRAKTFRSSPYYPKYYTLEELGEMKVPDSGAYYIDEELSVGKKNGYSFVLILDKQLYTITAIPIIPGITGRRFFLVDPITDDFVIHEAYMRPANIHDPIAPDSLNNSSPKAKKRIMKELREMVEKEESNRSKQ